MLTLNGQSLTLDEIAEVARGSLPVMLANEARLRIEASRRIVEDITSSGRVVYGINTGFGKLSDVHIPQSELRELQLNLVRSHACGVGRALPEEETRAMLLLRANVLSRGLSGARPVVVETLIAMLERGVHPVIPEKGSVGASGDLAPLAHLSLTVIGEGECMYQGKRMQSADGLRLAGIEPVRLEAKVTRSLKRYTGHGSCRWPCPTSRRNTRTYGRCCRGNDARSLARDAGRFRRTNTRRATSSRTD